MKRERARRIHRDSGVPFKQDEERYNLGKSIKKQRRLNVFPTFAFFFSMAEQGGTRESVVLERARGVVYTCSVCAGCTCRAKVARITRANLCSEKERKI